MVSSLLSILLALFLASKLPKTHRAFLFSIILIVLLPLVTYVLFGAKQVFCALTSEQFFRDFGFILKNCLAEPINLCRKDAAVDWQFAIPGILIVAGLVWGVGVMAFNQRRPEPRPVH